MYLFFLSIWQGGHKPEKPGILRVSLNMENTGNSPWKFCATWGKNCNKQSIFSSSLKYLDRVWGLVTCYIAGVDVEWPLMEVIITYTFFCDNVWKSKFMALEKPGKLREFFSSTLWPPRLTFLCKIQEKPLIMFLWSFIGWWHTARHCNTCPCQAIPNSTHLIFVSCWFQALLMRPVSWRILSSVDVGLSHPSLQRSLTL